VAAKERLQKRIADLTTLTPNNADYASHAQIALDSAVATVRDEFGRSSDEAGTFVAALMQAGSEVTHSVFDDYPREAADHANAVARVREAVPRLEYLVRLVDEKTVRDMMPSVPEPARQISRRVFVVHGHNEEAKQAVARVLERLHLQPIILHEQADMNRTIIEKFEAHADVGFAVVLMTGDDRGGPKAVNADQYKARARQNVLLEMGFFLGRLGRGHVCVLFETGVEMPSDYSGVLYKPLDSGGAWRWELAREIDAAGIPVDFNRLK
jgi:predicted nucleotide-binding protein